MTRRPSSGVRGGHNGSLRSLTMQNTLQASGPCSNTTSLAFADAASFSSVRRRLAAPPPSGAEPPTRARQSAAISSSVTLSSVSTGGMVPASRSFTSSRRSRSSGS